MGNDAPPARTVQSLERAFSILEAIAGSRDASARKKADALGNERSYGSYEALLDDPAVHVVHNTTPNYLHYPVNAAALARGKHVISDKPLAMTAAEARKLLDQATKAGVVHAVTFNYRGNPLVQQARLSIARGDIGRPHFLIGQYLQDWLLKDTDYSWRLEPDKGGASSALGDIGSHGATSLSTSARCIDVLGDITTVLKKRKRPKGSREAFQTGGSDDAFDLVDIAVEDLASVLLRFDNGAKGAFSVGQVCAGHKNDLILEISGSKASLRWTQEQQNDLWIGHRDKANELLQKDPSLIDAEARGYAHLPGGHQESWADAFANLMRDIYGFIAEGRKRPTSIRRHSRRSKTATVPTASSKPFSRARKPGAVDRGSLNEPGVRIQNLSVSHQSEPPLIVGCRHNSREAKPSGE
jgi:predicted dehydrogenase